MKMKTIVIILSMLLLASCYTQKKAEKQVTKAHINHPLVVAKFCGDVFPPKTITKIEKEYIQGKDSLIYDTISVDCEEVINEVERIVKVPVIREHYRVDTFRENRTDSVENTAKVKALEIALSDEVKLRVQAETKAKRLTNQSYFLWSWFVLSILGIGFIVYTKLFKPF